MAARATPAASRLATSRPTICPTATRPAASPPVRRAWATARTWANRLRPASSETTRASSTTTNGGKARDSAVTIQPIAPHTKQTTTTVSTPSARRRPSPASSRLSARSSRSMSRPIRRTGCGTTPRKPGRPPIMASRMRAASSRRSGGTVAAADPGISMARTVGRDAAQRQRHSVPRQSCISPIAEHSDEPFSASRSDARDNRCRIRCFRLTCELAGSGAAW